jgi:hypothetical protein
MRQQESTENEIRVVNRKWGSENIVVNELKLGLICASLNDISLGCL